MNLVAQAAADRVVWMVAQEPAPGEAHVGCRERRAIAQRTQGRGGLGTEQPPLGALVRLLQVDARGVHRSRQHRRLQPHTRVWGAKTLFTPRDHRICRQNRLLTPQTDDAENSEVDHPDNVTIARRRTEATSNNAPQGASANPTGRGICAFAGRSGLCTPRGHVTRGGSALARELCRVAVAAEGQRLGAVSVKSLEGLADRREAPPAGARLLPPQLTRPAVPESPCKRRRSDLCTLRDAGLRVPRGVKKFRHVPNPIDLQGRSNKCTPRALGVVAVACARRPVVGLLQRGHRPAVGPSDGHDRDLPGQVRPRALPR
jgi:hypothetical protein